MRYRWYVYALALFVVFLCATPWKMGRSWAPKNGSTMFWTDEFGWGG